MTGLEKKYEKIDILKNDLIENLDHELEDNYNQLRGYRHLRSDIKQLVSEIAALKQQGEVTDEIIQKYIEENCRNAHGDPQMDEQAFYEGAKAMKNGLIK